MANVPCDVISASNTEIVCIVNQAVAPSALAARGAGAGGAGRTDQPSTVRVQVRVYQMGKARVPPAFGKDKEVS